MRIISSDILGMGTINKIVFLGKGGVGKSSLIRRIRHDTFDHYVHPTIGAAFGTYKHTCKCGTIITIGLWDTAGSERFSELLPIFIRGSRVVVICFETPNVKEIKQHVNAVHNIVSDCAIFVCATKVDNQEPFVHSVVESYVRDIPYIHGLYHTSSLTGKGVFEMMNDIGEYIFQTYTGKEDVVVLDDKGKDKRMCRCTL